MITIPEDLLGRELDLGSVLVTAEMIAKYNAAVGNTATAHGTDAPATFCLALRRGMRPAIALPPDVFGVYGGHDLEFVHPLRAGQVYHITARIAEVYEKSGRSGRFTVIVREARILDDTGQLVARIVERQILRPRHPTAGPTRETASHG